jgi:hypothetical protein
MRPVELRRLTRADGAACARLTEKINWWQIRANWEWFIEWAGPGAFGLFAADDLRATAFAFTYEQRLAWQCDD